MTLPGDNGEQTLDDEFADEDEPFDFRKYITPEYLDWLNKMATGQPAADEYVRKLREEDQSK